MANIKSKVFKNEVGSDMERVIDAFLYGKNIDIISVTQVISLHNFIVTTMIYSINKGV
jgi:hypothetical protein